MLLGNFSRQCPITTKYLTTNQRRCTKMTITRVTNGFHFTEKSKLFFHKRNKTVYVFLSLQSREMMVQNQTTPNKSGTKTPPRASVGQTPPRTVVNQTPPTTTIPVITHQQILSALPSTSKVIAVSNNLTPIRSTALPSTNSPIIQQALNVPVVSSLTE